MKIMGILNVTPDSFSDGGKYINEATLEKRIKQLIREGADIIDVGGESTRPFAEPVDAEEELKRVVPAIRKIRSMSELPVSIDTTKAVVAREAIAAGATMINDISALRYDTDMIEVAKSFNGEVIIMHMQGTPEDMQVNPEYTDVVAEINDFFQERIDWMEGQGIDRARIILDPGIGFGKSLEHNLTILRNVSAFKGHGCQLLIGHSRKSFFGELLEIPVGERDWPTGIVSAYVERTGADVVRVHSVGETGKSLQLVRALS
ncbi:dihydropteroate synthase [Desulfobulbus rhabdoformis]|uniref:dihydropteroate synthase n=1 Tax=Desulfobulbus rhabdoformis TaxID=34032 RepID=UPI001F056880|nr:dihydropteroate synthase [Desulfobulbus rhabdoformis]